MTLRAAALAAAATATLAIVAAGCHRPAPDAPPADEATVAAIEDTGAADAAAIVPARCRRSEKVLYLDALGGARVAADGGAPGAGGELEIGDAIGYAGGVAVGLIHHTSAGRTAAVALLRADPTAGVRVVDLGPTLGDAPPPQLGRRNGELVAVAYALTSLPAGAPAADAGTGDATRGTAVYTIAGDAVTGSPLAVPQRRDESFALDVAFAGSSGLLVWDEATSAPRGVVRAASFARDHAEPARDVSPADSDAELPRVMASGAGFVVMWIARRPEATSLPEAAPAEATGEARTYGWLEAVAVDAHGGAIGPVRRLTSSTGHISAYDVVAVPLAVPGDATTSALLVVVARDDGEAVDGSGGALLRVRMRGEAIEPAEAIVTDGLGRGAPTLVAWPAPQVSAQPAPVWVSWAGKDEQGRLLPLSSTGAVTERPSAEDALGEGQPLLFLDPGPGVGAGVGPGIAAAVRPAAAPGIGPGIVPEAEVLVAAPSDPAGPLLLFACAQGAGH